MNRHLAILLAAALLPAMRAAAEEPEVDTSKWPCKFCEYEEGFVITPNLGVGYVSDSSAKFGEYNGLDEEGAYVVADAEGRYRNEDGRWLDLSAIDLGLDSRYFGVEGGKQGQYQLHLAYKELPHNLTDTARSPFLGIGGGSLTLPSGWVRGSTTGDMSALNASLGAIDLDTQRRLIDFGGSFVGVKHWSFALDFRHEEKEGTRGTGGTFAFSDAQLAMPVHYTTDQIDVSAAYGAERLQARIAYYGSIFKNDDEALRWANPYIPLNGEDLGQIGLAPGNQFHQLVMTAAYKVARQTQLTADVAYGHMTQDEAFLPYTVNDSLVTSPLPRGSLDGSVDTLTGKLKITTALADELRVNASYTYNERNNNTPTDLYEWITTDTAPSATPRTNLPYSFNHSVASIDAAFAFSSYLRIYAGCDYDEYRRDLQEVERTNESGCWGKANLSAKDFATLSLQYTHTQRTGSAYNPNPDGTPAQNPLMRLYNMADRNRDEMKLRVDVTPGEKFSFGFDIRSTWDDYFNTTVGLLEGNSWSAAADCAWAISQKFSASCYLSHEETRSRQANAELLASAPLWFGSNDDKVDSLGAGFKYGASKKFDVGLDYSYSKTSGEVAIDSAVVGFPDLTTSLNSARLYVDFSPKEKLSLRLSYWYESYRSEDWQLDDVLPATIPNVLAFGQESPDYDINVVALTGRYEF